MQGIGYKYLVVQPATEVKIAASEQRLKKTKVNACLPEVSYKFPR
jgi:hypothetical protein